MVNDGRASNLLASILNNGIELVGVKKDTGWIVNDTIHEWVESSSSDQSIRPLSFPVRNSYGMTGELPSGYEQLDGFLDRSR
jgi:hypothetical protein